MIWFFRSTGGIDFRSGRPNGFCEIITRTRVLFRWKRTPRYEWVEAGVLGRKLPDKHVFQFNRPSDHNCPGYNANYIHAARIALPIAAWLAMTVVVLS